MQSVDLQSEVAHSLAKYRNHLEFSGYKVVEEVEDYFYCQHPRKVNLGLKKISTRGVLVSALFGVQENLNRLDLLEYLNSLNEDFLFMKAYVTEEGTLCIETFFEGEYDRTNFSLLLENIDLDMQEFWNNELTATYIA